MLKKIDILEGGPNPRVYNYGVQIRQQIWSEGTRSASGFGPGGPGPLADLVRGDQVR